MKYILKDKQGSLEAAGSEEQLHICLYSPHLPSLLAQLVEYERVNTEAVLWAPLQPPANINRSECFLVTVYIVLLKRKFSLSAP